LKMFMEDSSQEEEVCELVRACRALHCPLCDSLFSTAEDAQHAPLALACGHSICRACLADGLARLWNGGGDEDDGFGTSDEPKSDGPAHPPCTCPECGQSFAPDGEQAFLPFFNAAMAHAVLQLQTLAKGMSFSPHSDACCKPKSSDEDKHVTDAAMQTDEVREEEYARLRFGLTAVVENEDSVEVKGSGATNVRNLEAASESPDPTLGSAPLSYDDAMSECDNGPSTAAVASTNPFEDDLPPKKPEPKPARAPVKLVDKEPPSNIRFSYFPFSVGRASTKDEVVLWLAKHVPASSSKASGFLARLYSQKDASRVKNVAASVEETLMPVFVPFITFTLIVRVDGKTAGPASKEHSQKVVTCSWDIHGGRDAANETVASIEWKNYRLAVCDPEERPRPGLWLPTSTQNAETAPKSMPKLTALRTEAIVTPYAQMCDKRAREAYTKQGHDAEELKITVRAVRQQRFYVPFWIAGVELPEFNAILVNGLNGKVSGSATPLLELVREAKARHDQETAQLKQ